MTQTAVFSHTQTHTKCTTRLWVKSTLWAVQDPRLNSVSSSRLYGDTHSESVGVCEERGGLCCHWCQRKNKGRVTTLWVYMAHPPRLRFRVTVASAWGVTLSSASIKAKERWANSLAVWMSRLHVYIITSIRDSQHWSIKIRPFIPLCVLNYTNFGETLQRVVHCVRMIHVARRSSLWVGH